MRVLAIATLASLGLLALLAPAGAARPVPEPPIHVEFVQCVTDPCPPQVWCDPEDSGGAIRYERFHDCSQRVSIDVIDCLWGEEWVTYQAGPVTVRSTQCREPYPPQ